MFSLIKKLYEGTGQNVMQILNEGASCLTIQCSNHLTGCSYFFTFEFYLYFQVLLLLSHIQRLSQVTSVLS